MFRSLDYNLKHSKLCKSILKLSIVVTSDSIRYILPSQGGFNRIVDQNSDILTFTTVNNKQVFGVINMHKYITAKKVRKLSVTNQLKSL